MEILEKILKEIQNENLYKILGIERTDDHHVIKRAYKKSVKHYHPDKNKDKDTVEIFQKIQKAYEILKNEELKTAYDLHLDKKEFNKIRLENLDSERKKFADDLKKREEENLRESRIEREENILKKKQQREKFSEFSKFPEKAEFISSPKKKTFEEKLQKTGVKIKWSKNLQFVITKETIYSYFKEFGMIDEIVCRNDSNKAFILFNSDSNFSQILNLIKNDKVIKQLFKIKRLNRLNNSEQEEGYDKIKSAYLDSNVLNKIKNMKMQNNIEFMKSKEENANANTNKTNLYKENEKEFANVRENKSQSPDFDHKTNDLFNLNLDDFEKQAFEKLKMKSKK